MEKHWEIKNFNDLLNTMNDHFYSIHNIKDSVHQLKTLANEFIDSDNWYWLEFISNARRDISKSELLFIRCIADIREDFF